MKITGNNGEIAQIIDNGPGRLNRSEYDLSNRPIRKMIPDTNGGRIYETEVGYDQYNNPARLKEKISGIGTFVTDIACDTENRPVQITYSSGETLNYTNDGLGRKRAAWPERWEPSSRSGTADMYMTRKLGCTISGADTTGRI